MHWNIQIVIVAVFGMALEVFHFLEQQFPWTLEILFNPFILVIDMDLYDVCFIINLFFGLLYSLLRFWRAVLRWRFP